MKKIGLFGGSFNPIHNGHIAIAKAILEQCSLDEIWLMVSPQNPFKQSSQLLEDNKRFELVQKALDGVEGIKASDYEFKLAKPSYTWNTLKHLKVDYPDYTFILLIGGDNWARFSNWYMAEKIIEEYHVIIYPRRGIVINYDDLPINVSVVETPLLDISSTEIRERLFRHDSITGMVPNNIVHLVEDYYHKI